MNGIPKAMKACMLFPLERYEEAFDTFVHRKDGAIKVVVEP